MTPEGRVKAKLNRLLAKYETIYKFMPVPGGYGSSSLDYVLCVGGRFLAIETKAPGKQPTPRQHKIIEQIEAAGGLVFVFDGDEKCLREIKKVLDNYATGTR